MIGKKIRLLILAVGIYALSVTGLRADVDWFPSGDKVNSQGFAVSSSGDYEEGDRIVNTALLDVGGGTAAGEELRAPSSKRFKTKKNKKWKTRGGEVEESDDAAEATTIVAAGASNIQFTAISYLNQRNSSKK